MSDFFHDDLDYSYLANNAKAYQAPTAKIAVLALTRGNSLTPNISDCLHQLFSAPSPHYCCSGYLDHPPCKLLLLCGAEQPGVHKCAISKFENRLEL